MKILFLGTSDFAVPVLTSLAGAGASPALVVTAPNRPSGRGRHETAPPVAEAAGELGLPLFQPENVNAPEAHERLAVLAPDLVVVVAYGQILRRPLLELPRLAIVNLHGSILPAFRGAAPIARAIQAGETETGVTLQHVVREVDAGDVIDVAPMRLEPEETAGEASARMSRLAADLLLRNLERLATGTAPRFPQDPGRVSYAPQLDKNEGRIDWACSARRIHDHVRAMTPWPSAFTEWVDPSGKRERIVLRRSAVVKETGDGAPPGTILAAERELDVQTGSGILRVQRLLRSGKRESDAETFLRGARIAPGTRFE